MSNGTKVTIQDIADALGISRNTVSKAINNSEGIADSTRIKILNKATEMGYKQFSYVASAVGLTDSRALQDTFGHQAEPGSKGEITLLTAGLINQSHFASTTLDIFQQELHKMGYLLNLLRVPEEDVLSLSLPSGYNSDATKAIVCIEIFDWDYAQMLCSLNVPILFIDGPARINGRFLPADQLYMENFSPVESFVHDMIERGCSRIGFIGSHSHCQSFYERYSAFYLGVSMSGRPIDNAFIINSNEYSVIKNHLSNMKDFPDVFICANDFLAIDVIQILSGLGKSVPEDVLICGFDDAQESKWCKPQLTTIRINTEIIAYSASYLLMSRINTPDMDYRVVHTETNMIYRESTEKK